MRSFLKGGCIVENIMKELVDFASSWALDLEIQHDIDIEGKSAHRLYSNAREDSGNTAVDFFFLVPEEKTLCVCVPSNLTIEGLRKTYGLELEEVRWAGFPNDARTVCIKTGQFNLHNFLCKEFVQHMMGARANQFGMELYASLSGNTGGCGGV
jgi:hypothetical protein